MEAHRQTVAKKLQYRILPGWPPFSGTHHNNSKLFLLAFFCLLVVLVFEISVSFDGNFTNDDPPFQVSASGIVPSCLIETRLLKHFGERLYPPTINKFDLPPRAPPIA
jgi:hypothetical protein